MTARPLLARVRDELVALDRDGLLDLTTQPACRELVEITREVTATLLVHRPGQPFSRADASRLLEFLAGTGVTLTLGDPGA